MIKQSIGRKILWASVVGLFLSMVTATVSFLWFYRVDTFNGFESSLQAARQAVGRVAALQSSRSQAALNSILHSPRFVSALSVGIHDMPTLRDLSRTEFELLADAEWFSVFSDQGEHLLSIGEGSSEIHFSTEEKAALSARDFIQVHLDDAVMAKNSSRMNANGVFESLDQMRNGLFRVTTAPVYDAMDNLLGILLIGDAINAAVATELSGITGCHVTYIGPDRVYATSLGLEEQSVRDDLIRNTPKPDAKPQIWGNQLLMVQALNTGENSPGVVLVIKRSLDRFYANQYRVVAVSALIFLILIGLSLLLNAALSRRIVRPIRELTLAFTAVGRGDLSVQVKVDTGDEVQMLAETFSEMVIGLRERANMSRYLTGMEMDAVKSAVEKNTEVSQGGNKKIVSVLFSDIRSFTTMCEKCDPALVIESLNYYFNALIPIIEANGGSLDKLIGDCIMAVFEDSPGHNSADNAVKAAIEMQRKAKQIEVEMESKGYLKFLAGFGVNSGMAVVGNIGTADQMSRTVLGDSVNLAARIEALSKEGKHTGVLCSEYTVELLRGEWPLELLMETTVKGKTQPVKIYEVTKL